MNFFIPAADSPEQAERVLSAIHSHCGGTMGNEQTRIYKIDWQHNGNNYSVKVGEKVDKYFGGEIVIAIIDAGAVYKVCTPNRGVVRGDGIFVSKDAFITYFE